MEEGYKEKQVPFQLLIPVLETLKQADNLLPQKFNGGQLQRNLRQSIFTVSDVLKLSNEDNPFWYKLYEGLVDRYLELRRENHEAIKQLKELKKEHANLKDRYFSLGQQLDSEHPDSDERL
ncbi:hypothetical protein [Polluticaenibacter yanchengensis]|uniref:Uncharacterized protein n=1 Tax=Polluticaenibacter yanchengensis TaxID=3014562 RepID=A0ABT4UJE6_9BACT|nr:hypothetical protein [Chitinophagaceae bacterium LY-5]